MSVRSDEIHPTNTRLSLPVIYPTDLPRVTQPRTEREIQLQEEDQRRRNSQTLNINLRNFESNQKPRKSLLATLEEQKAISNLAKAHR
ncbi:hypothetical protein ElyMa_005769500 [Elysia marginata]|uniref:Uncharacterized protein n=1 Tax=Elysia marginata TaxID=1093978 RepID=A0AAV4FP69_9GAST|nr:hypothetical protein ElyMa_005769500 [Elysia marginata]